MTRKSPEALRSARWLSQDDFRSHSHRARMMQLGYEAADWVGKPVIAVVNTWSEFNPCHGHFKERAEDVKRGVLQAGGFPLELPMTSLFEVLLKPSAMLLRNLLAMETEELLRAYPIDGAVLMGGCDKSTPGLLMGAISMNIPAVYLPAGPMAPGNAHGRTLGSGTDAFKYWDEYRAGRMSETEHDAVTGGIARSFGHCMVMGTASTMTGITEALGLTIPGASSIPAVDANHSRMGAASGRRIVDMVWEDLTPEKVLSRASFTNAIIVAMAMGCSTNAVIHLIALARRAGFDITLADFDALSRTTPVLANIRPSGDKYLMQDFYFAGGLRGLMSRLKDKLDLSAMTVSGKTLGETLDGAQVWNDDVIRPLDNPIYKEGALAVLTGNLAPDGCVIKPSACSPKFLQHSGPAMVFDDYPSMKKAIDDPNLDVTEDHIMILRNAGPKGGPSMPEWGMIPIPLKLVKQGVKDMMRLSDARMSGTSYGACVLHVAPEAFVGGPLALVRNGDVITVDVPARTIRLEVSDEDLAARKAAWVAPPPRYERGYGHIYSQHVTQANEGCDFDFLETGFGKTAGEPAIF